ncbi:MAG: AMP-binding protein, partial [Gammaproteobacteria bacterium]|nr:AMP-binding protein [Gammaproteobacteria bacterium]
MPPCHPLYHAELSPDKPAWFFDEQVTTYEALGVSLLQGAQMLRKLGLKTGDGIAVLAENHPDSLALYWAAQTAGLYYTPISVQFQAAEVQH